MAPERKSFFERLTGSIALSDDEMDNLSTENVVHDHQDMWAETAPIIEEEGELSVDVYQNGNDVIIQAMIAGVKPDDLTISVTRESVTIKGKRERNAETIENGYVVKELYWGAFSRTITLPTEVDTDGVEAIEKHGLITIRLPRLDKARTQKVKVKSI